MKHILCLFFMLHFSFFTICMDSTLLPHTYTQPVTIIGVPCYYNDLTKTMLSRKFEQNGYNHCTLKENNQIKKVQFDEQLNNFSFDQTCSNQDNSLLAYLYNNFNNNTSFIFSINIKNGTVEKKDSAQTLRLSCFFSHENNKLYIAENNSLKLLDLTSDITSPVIFSTPTKIINVQYNKNKNHILLLCEKSRCFLGELNNNQIDKYIDITKKLGAILKKYNLTKDNQQLVPSEIVLNPCHNIFALIPFFGKRILLIQYNFKTKKINIIQTYDNPNFLGLLRTWTLDGSTLVTKIIKADNSNAYMLANIDTQKSQVISTSNFIHLFAEHGTHGIEYDTVKHTYILKKLSTLLSPHKNEPPAPYKILQVQCLKNKNGYDYCTLMNSNQTKKIMPGVIESLKTPSPSYYFFNTSKPCATNNNSLQILDTTIDTAIFTLFSAPAKIINIQSNTNKNNILLLCEKSNCFIIETQNGTLSQFINMKRSLNAILNQNTIRTANQQLIPSEIALNPCRNIFALIPFLGNSIILIKYDFEENKISTKNIHYSSDSLGSLNTWTLDGSILVTKIIKADKSNAYMFINIDTKESDIISTPNFIHLFTEHGTYSIEYDRVNHTYIQKKLSTLLSTHKNEQLAQAVTQYKTLEIQYLKNKNVKNPPRNTTLLSQLPII